MTTRSARSTVFRVLATLLCLALLAACGSPEETAEPAAPPPADEADEDDGTDTTDDEADDDEPEEGYADHSGVRVAFGTGITGGGFFALGTAIAQHLSNELGAEFIPEPTEGSVHAVRLLASGEFDMALTSPDAVFFMTEGTGPFEGTDHADDLRSFLPGPETGLSFIVRADSDIETFDDLVGRDIAVGGTIVQTLVSTLWEGLGHPEFEAEVVSYSEMGPALIDRHIEVGVFSTWPRQAGVIDLTTTTDVRFIDLSPDAVEFLRAEHPYWAPVEVPAGTYEGQDEGTLGPGLYMTPVVRADVDEQLVYDSVKAIVEQNDRLAAIHEGGASLTLDQLSLYEELGILFLPLHPGVQRYVDEHS